MLISSNRNISTQNLPGGKIEPKDKSKLDIFEKSTDMGEPVPQMTNVKPSENEIPWKKDQRPAKYIKTTQDGRIHIGDVRMGFKEADKKENWEPIFKEVSVDPSKVKDVYFVIKPFTPEFAAGHILTCFEFEDGQGLKTSDGETQNGLVVSFEGRLKENQSYGLVDGFKKKFKTVYQLGSWKDVVQKTCRREGHKLVRYKLNLTDDQKKELLKNSLEASFKDRTDEYYHTTRNSCYSNQVDLLNSVLPEDEKMKQWVIPDVLHNPETSIPAAGSFILGYKGIIDDSPPVMTEPDKTLFPEKQEKHSFIREAIKKLSEKKGWHLASELTGLFLGAALGSLILPELIAIPVLGYLGCVVGKRTSHWLERETHAVPEPSEKYFQEAVS